MRAGRAAGASAKSRLGAGRRAPSSAAPTVAAGRCLAARRRRATAQSVRAARARNGNRSRAGPGRRRFPAGRLPRALPPARRRSGATADVASAAATAAAAAAASRNAPVARRLPAGRCSMWRWPNKEKEGNSLASAGVSGRDVGVAAPLGRRCRAAGRRSLHFILSAPTHTSIIISPPGFEQQTLDSN